MHRILVGGLLLACAACGGDDEGGTPLAPSAAESGGAAAAAGAAGGAAAPPSGSVTSPSTGSEAPGDVPLDAPPIDDTGASATGEGGAPPVGPVDTTLRIVEADDPNIVYSGRIDFSDPKQPTYSAPAATIGARFNGDAISALLGDEFRYGSERSFYDVIVDGQVVSKLAPEQGVDKYPLASGLTPGEHSVSLVKRTQAQLGKGTFRGFEVGGTLLPPAPPAALKLEFIGDSITAGEGIDAVNASPECSQNANGDPTGWGQPFHNADRSHAVLTSRALGADYQVTAVSGIGLVHDYSAQYDTRPMAEVYDLLFVEETESPAWDHARYVPDAVMIALGTNDFSSATSGRMGLAPSSRSRPIETPTSPS